MRIPILPTKETQMTVRPYLSGYSIPNNAVYMCPAMLCTCVQQCCVHVSSNAVYMCPTMLCTCVQQCCVHVSSNAVHMCPAMLCTCVQQCCAHVYYVCGYLLFYLFSVWFSDVISLNSITFVTLLHGSHLIG